MIQTYYKNFMGNSICVTRLNRIPLHPPNSVSCGLAKQDQQDYTSAEEKGVELSMKDDNKCLNYNDEKLRVKPQPYVVSIVTDLWGH